jgi:hypothetical protein
VREAQLTSSLHPCAVWWGRAAAVRRWPIIYTTTCVDHSSFAFACTQNQPPCTTDDIQGTKQQFCVRHGAAPQPPHLFSHPVIVDAYASTRARAYPGTNTASPTVLPAGTAAAGHPSQSRGPSTQPPGRAPRTADSRLGFTKVFGSVGTSVNTPAYAALHYSSPTMCRGAPMGVMRSEIVLPSPFTTRETHTLV